MAGVAGIASERVHGWFRLLTETLGRRKHFAVSFLSTTSQDNTKTRMEEVLMLDDPPPPPPPPPSSNTGSGSASGPGAGRVTSQKPSGQTPYTISVTVNRGSQGYGFSVSWTKPPRVEKVDPGSPAERAGLLPGDYIIFVGHHNVVKAVEDSVLEMIRECGANLPLEVYRRGVSKPPRGLMNGTSNHLAPSELHPRTRLSHISFTSEGTPGDRQSCVFTLINCEQAFSNSCRFGIERYLIPLKFRTDLLTHTEHTSLFNNIDQLVDMSEHLVERLMGKADDNIGEGVGNVYHDMVEEVSEHYCLYMSALPEADKVLALKYLEEDFKDFLTSPTVPRKKPDITTFIHKPAEHLREVIGLMGKVYTAEPSHPDNAYLTTVLHKLKNCYRGVTSQQNIMEPAPPTMSPPTDADPAITTTADTPTLTLSTPAPAPGSQRPPLVSVTDIEPRLVFTKYTQPFRLDNGARKWVFGGELHKFEGRHLRQYWAMLFSDLLLFTKINRDRVIFVMEDPVPLASVLQACFTVKKKATEFRLIIDTRVKASGSNMEYLSRSPPPTSSPTGSLKGHKRTLVLRAPTVDLKATWNNLIRKQLYALLAGSSTSTTNPASVSVPRAASTDGLYVLAPQGSRYTSSVGDLRRGAGCEEVVLDLDNETEPPTRTSCFKSSKLTVKKVHGREEELVLEDDDIYLQPGYSLPPQSSTSAPPTLVPSAVKVAVNATHPDFKFVIEDEPHEPSRSPARRAKTSKSSKASKSKSKPVRSSRSSKVKHSRNTGGCRSSGYGGGDCVTQEEEIIHNLDKEEQGPTSHNSRSTAANQSALQNQRQNSVPEIVCQDGAEDNNENCKLTNASHAEEEMYDDLAIKDVKTGAQTCMNPKGKGIGVKVRDKLFPSRNLPKKKMNRTKKAEQYVDSLAITDFDNHGRVTPLFIGEETLSNEDFAKKRKDLLLHKPKNYFEGDEEVLNMHSPSMTPEPNSGISKKLGMDKKTTMNLSGIDEEPTCSSSAHVQDTVPSTTMLSPEEYEDYIGDTLEKDYPELTGISTDPASYIEPYQPQVKEHPQETQNISQEEAFQQKIHLPELYHQEQYSNQQTNKEALQPSQPTGPLSGSASMNFMDDHSPTSNGTAASRGLKRYGSSCDIAGLASGTAEEPAYICDDNYNANCKSNYDANYDTIYDANYETNYSTYHDASNLKSKAGGTGSGVFVAGKLALYEKVVEEEHQKFIEGQEVRKRIYRLPKKSGEYLEKFYSPQVIDNVDARANEYDNEVYYDDEYDRPRSTSPCSTPYGGSSSPPNIFRNRSSYSTCYDPCRSLSPTIRSPQNSPVLRMISQPKTQDPIQRTLTPISPPKTPSPEPKSPPLSPLPSFKRLDPKFPVTSTTNYGDDYAGGYHLQSPASTNSKAEIRQCSPTPPWSSDNQTNSILEQRTDEALEMLDMSYLDEPPWGADSGCSSGRQPLSPPTTPPSSSRKGNNNNNNNSNDSNKSGGGKNCTRSPTSTPPPALPTSTSTDNLDDVFEIEAYDSMGSTTSIEGRRNKRAAPPIPSSSSCTPPATAASKVGGFFERVRKGKEAPNMDKVKKIKEKKKKKTKEAIQEDGNKATGRFQLFSAPKKTSEVSPAEDCPRSPKKEKAGMKRLFGRGKENFLGRTPTTPQASDPQVARMAGDSFDQESIGLVGDEEEVL